MPKDAIGNEVRKNAMVHMKLPEAAILCRVMDIQPASTIPGPDSKGIAVNGSVTFAIQFPLTAQNPNLPMCLVLQEPKIEEAGPKLIRPV